MDCYAAIGPTHLACLDCQSLWEDSPQSPSTQLQTNSIVLRHYGIAKYMLHSLARTSLCSIHASRQRGCTKTVDQGEGNPMVARLEAPFAWSAKSSGRRSQPRGLGDAIRHVAQNRTRDARDCSPVQLVPSTAVQSRQRSVALVASCWQLGAPVLRHVVVADTAS